MGIILLWQVQVQQSVAIIYILAIFFFLSTQGVALFIFWVFMQHAGKLFGKQPIVELPTDLCTRFINWLINLLLVG